MEAIYKRAGSSCLPDHLIICIIYTLAAFMDHFCQVDFAKLPINRLLILLLILLLFLLLLLLLLLHSLLDCDELHQEPLGVAQLLHVSVPGLQHLDLEQRFGVINVTMPLSTSSSS